MDMSCYRGIFCQVHDPSLWDIAPSIVESKEVYNEYKSCHIFPIEMVRTSHHVLLLGTCRWGDPAR